MNNQTQANQSQTTDREAQLASLRKAISQAKEIRSRALGQLDTLNKQEEALVKECGAIGVKPEGLEEALRGNQEEFGKLYEETVGLVPWGEIGVPEPVRTQGGGQGPAQGQGSGRG